MAVSGCITRGRGGQFKILAGAHIRKTFILSLPRDISVHTKSFSGCKRQELEILGRECCWKVQLGSCGLDQAEILTISGNRGHLEIISDEYIHTNTNTQR